MPQDKSTSITKTEESIPERILGSNLADKGEIGRSASDKKALPTEENTLESLSKYRRASNIFFGGAVLANLLALSFVYLVPSAKPLAISILIFFFVVVPLFRLSFKKYGLFQSCLMKKHLKETQEQQNLTEKLARIASWSQDLRTKENYWSKNKFLMLELDPKGGPLVLESFVKNIHPNDRQCFRDSFLEAIQNKKDLRVEYRWICKNGSVVWLRSIGKIQFDHKETPIYMRGIIQDISGMKAMQQQLASSEAKFRDLTSLSSDWSWETDKSHRLTYLSDSVDAVLGSWHRSTIGRARWENPHLDFLNPDWDSLNVICSEQKPFENFEYSQIDEDENFFHLSINGKPIFNDENEFIGYRGTGRNITKEKQQRILLEIEGEIAVVMREQSDPARVITTIMISLCDKLGWVGALRLEPTPNGFEPKERWGYPSFTKMVSDLPKELITDNTLELECWKKQKYRWVRHLNSYPDFVKRYRIASLSIKAVFLAPILDQEGNTTSLLIFFSPVAFRGETFFGQIADILLRTLSLYTQRKLTERRLWHASLHDGLTGLPNRNHLVQQIKSQLRANQHAALMYIDLDRYKNINDSLGHAAGDKALIEIARRMRKLIRQEDIVSRVGGDEFVILLNNLNDKNIVEGIARSILAEIEKPLELNAQPYFLSASIGIALSPFDGNDPDSLMRNADSAMYKVKAEGRNEIKFFSGEISAAQAEEIEFLAELPVALQKKQLVLLYQPIMNISERKITSFEGILFWDHPKKGLISHERFSSASEKANVSREIGYWVLQRAIEDRAQLLLNADSEIAVSVNLSAVQLTEPGFLKKLSNLMLLKRFPSKYLTIELTESAIVEQSDRNIELLSEIKKLGIKVLIDSFGTGYASLSYLKDLPIDGLKIDQIFIKNIALEPGNAAIVQAITTMSAKLGLQAIGVGVENTSELHELRVLHCDQVQGPLISEPLTFQQLKEFIDAIPQLCQAPSQSSELSP